MPAYTLYYFNGRGRAEAIRMMFGVAGVQFADKRIEFNEWDKYRNEMPCSVVPVLEIDGKNNRMPETMAICRYLAREFGFYGKSSMEMFRNDYISDCLYELMHDYMRYFHDKNGRFRCNMDSNMSSNMGSNMNKTSNMNSSMGTSMNSNMGSNMSSGRSNSMSSNTSSQMGSSSNKNTSPMTSQTASNMTNMGSNMNSQMSSGTGSSGSYMQMRFMETSRRILPFLERTLGMHCGGNKFFLGEQLMMCDMLLYCFLETPMMEFQQMFNSYPKLMAMMKRVSSHPKVSSYLQKRIKGNW